MKNANEFIELQANLLKGMYIDSVKKFDTYDIYESEIIKDAFWNFAYVTDPETFVLSDLISKVEEQLANDGNSSCVYIEDRHIHHDKLKEYLFNNSYEPQDTDAIMIYKENYDIECKYSYREANDENNINDFMQVLNDAFGGEKTEENPYGGAVDSSYEIAIKKSLLNNENKFHHIVLYDNEIPVSCATLVYKNGWAGIYNVGTKRDSQNMGYGKSIMAALLKTFKELGGENIYLFTEKDSKNEMWYNRLGFETIYVNKQYIKYAI